MTEPRGSDRLRAIARSPGWQLAVCGLVLAFAYPARSSGAIGLTIVAGALGVAVAMLWPRAPAWLRTPPSDVTTVLVLTVVATAGITVFWEALTVSPDWPMGDWGPHHAVLAGVVKSMPGLDLPVWNHAVGTGDAPLELYPAFTTVLVGHLAVAFGLEHDLPLALSIVSVAVYLVIVLATTVIAMRVAPKPIALLVGLLTLVDSGAVAHGGTVGLFRWALLHSALSLSFSLIAGIAILSALRRPRLGASVAIWVFTALATASHPAGLLATAATGIALAAVALLASDVPPRRAVVAMGHLAIGAALGACVWMPLAQRILLYGQHYPNALRSPDRLLEDLLASPSPVTAFAMLGYAGYFGILAGLWSRKASVVFVCASALVLLVGLSDAAFMAFDLAPGQGVARLGTERLASLARPFVMASAAYGISVFVRAALRGWRDASRDRRLIAAAIIGILSGAVVRVLPAVWSSSSARAAGETQVLAADPAGRQQLTDWARVQVLLLGPEHYGRALFEEDTHEHLHLTADTGLPTLHLTWLPDLLLRERIEDTTPETLRRFNVRWIVAIDHSPSLGDPDTERTFGSYHVRELPEWDGKFARIERGTGEVRVVRLDDRAVEIDVTGTTEPVLVALGTGFYPRWRARHASGASEPVYALPTHPDATLHVVSAWVAPGRTMFTVDGALPSDHSGRSLSILAALCALAAIVAWTFRRLRLRILRRLARLRARLPRIATVAATYGIPLLALVLVARGCIESRGVTKSLEVGGGIRATSTVEARGLDGEWQTCGYSRLEGDFMCPGIATIYDGMVNTLNDAHPSWGFNTPAIVVIPEQPDIELRVRLEARLGGTYWAAVSGGSVTLDVAGEESRSITRSVFVVPDAGERSVELRAKLSSAGPWSFTCVHEDTILPPRPFLAGPPETAPAAVRAIH